MSNELVQWEQGYVSEQENLVEQDDSGQQVLQEAGFGAPYENTFEQGGERAYYGGGYYPDDPLAAPVAITPYLTQPCYAPYPYYAYPYPYPYYPLYGYDYPGYTYP
jgi:hypothetical protein